MKSIEHNVLHFSPMVISFDKENPRGETEDVIMEDPSFGRLQISIEEHGIIEPLIVKKDMKKEGHYKLIDGERRLRVAKALPLELVPVLLAKDDSDGRILAYQVHMLRKKWSTAAEAKSIKKIVIELRKNEKNISETKLRQRLKKITGKDGDNLNKMLGVIKFSDECIDKAVLGKIDVSYLVEIDSNFVKPIKTNLSEIFKVYSEDQIRDIMAKKAEHGLLTHTRIFRKRNKLFKDVKNRKRVLSLIKKFLKNAKEKIEILYDSYDKIADENVGKKKEQNTKKDSKIKKSKSEKKNRTTRIKITPTQEKNLKSIRNGFEVNNSKLSEEELSYISEALDCVERENPCPKAAIVMIWAAGISRILDHIDSDHAKFMFIMDKMSKEKWIYKKMRETMQSIVKNKKTKEELRDGKDMALILYWLGLGYISKTEYKKLRADYDTRCDCSHPTDVTLKMHELLKVLDDVQTLIFSNEKVI